MLMNHPVSEYCPHLFRVGHKVEIENLPLVEVVGAEEVAVLRREKPDAGVVGSRANHTGEIERSDKVAKKN